MKRDLFRPGCIRIDTRGVWLLNKRETGWASFGFRYRDLDALLADWNVRVVEGGRDEHGEYLVAEPVTP